LESTWNLVVGGGEDGGGNGNGGGGGNGNGCLGCAGVGEDGTGA